MGSEPSRLGRSLRFSHLPSTILQGAYFTDYPPNEPNLAKKLFIPRRKLEYIFSFTPPKALLSIPGGRGRLNRIFYSPEDYPVERRYQIHHGETGL